MLQTSPSCTMALPMETFTSLRFDSNDSNNSNVNKAMHESVGVDDAWSSRWDDRIDKGSTERECRSLLSFSSPISNDSSSWGLDGNKHVCFKSIRIKQYERILGDHPSCSAGAPIGIGWTILHDETVDLNEYELERTFSRKQSQSKLILRREERETILSEWGVTNREMVASIRRNATVKRQRRRTAQTSCYDSLEEALEKASRHIKNGLLQTIPMRRSPKFSKDDVYVSNRSALPRRPSEDSKETVDSDPPSLTKSLRNTSRFESTSDQVEIQQVANTLTELLLSSTERLNPSFKKSACSEMNACPPKRVVNSEPSSVSNNEMSELSRQTNNPLLEETDDESGMGSSFPQSAIVGFCDWEGMESSITSIVECDFDSENFSESTL